MVILYIYLTCWHMKSVFYERQQAHTTRQKTPPPGAWQAAQPSRCGGGQQYDPLLKVTPHPWRTDYSLSQLRTLGLQKGKLLDPFLALPLELLLAPLNVGRYVRQAMRVRLGHLLSLARLYELTLEKDNPPSKHLGLPAGRSQRCSTLCLHPPYPLLGLPFG
jgi:hypothetical protein